MMRESLRAFAPGTGEGWVLNPEDGDQSNPAAAGASSVGNVSCHSVDESKQHLNAGAVLPLQQLLRLVLPETRVLA